MLAARKACEPKALVDVKAKDKGKKIGYINQQVDKKLLIASKNMSRDAWTKLAIQVSKMDDDQKKAWINAKI